MMTMAGHVRRGRSPDRPLNGPIFGHTGDILTRSTRITFWISQEAKLARLASNQGANGVLQ